MSLQVFVLDRVLEEDGITGDAYGPYDPDLVDEERRRVAREKVCCPNLSLLVCLHGWSWPCISQRRGAA